MALTVGSFAGEAGFRIAHRSWAPRTPRAPRACVVVAHTALDHSGRYDEFAQVLVRRGMAVWAHDHRGHGRSDGDAGVIESFDFAVRDLGRMVDIATGGRDGAVFLVAHSMGALIAIAWVLEHPGRCAGLVTTGATLDSSPAPRPLRLLGDALHLDRVGAWLSPRFPLLAFPSSAFTTDPVEARAHDEDPLVHHGRIPMRTASEIASAVRGHPCRRLGDVDAPLLAIHGGADAIVGPEASRRLVDCVASVDKELVVLEGLRHDVLHERQPERADLHARIAAWIEARSGSGTVSSAAPGG